MATPYLKIPVGNKRFVIEWNLNANNSEVVGDAFEAWDCRPVSISSRTESSSVTPKLHASNHSPQWASAPILLRDTNGNGIFTVPLPGGDGPHMPPPTRFIFPSLTADGVAGSSVVSILFEVI